MKQPLSIKRIRKSTGGLRLLPLVLFTFLLLTLSCSSIDCPVENVVATVYQLKKADGSADTLADKLTIITTRRDGTDSILLNESENTKTIQLPMGYTNPEDTLRFTVTDDAGSYTDTVFIKKENTPHFESVDCSVTFFHTITDVRLSSHNAIDSITINKASVSYDLSTAHFNIYFKSER